MVMKRLSYKQQWLGDISQNIMAGILMGLALLPVAIAFSFIVHISPTIGLMSCGLMMLFISFLGERISMVSGPSSGISIVGAPLVEQYNIHYLIMATFIMGIILIIFGMCHIDKILNHIPDTVVIGFMNALGILLLTTQIKYIFGITTATYLSSTFIRFMPAPHIAISVVTLASYFLKPNVQLVHDLAEIRLNFPKISVYTELLNIHALSIITLYALTMSIICVVQTNLTNEMMDVITQSHSNKDREVIGQGLANLFVGLLGGYGSSALVGQSKFNFKMGATTRLATFVIGLFLLSCVIILGPIVGFIPMAVLASVLITISMNTFDRRTFKHLKEAPIKHSIVMFITIILMLMSHNLAIGVVIGTLIYYVVHFIFTKKGRASL